MSATSFKSLPVVDKARNTTGNPRFRLFWHVAVALFIVAAWFGSLELRGLFIPDEGRYAEIPREMLATGDWITPRLNDLKYFEKPPLQYWMTALSFRLFGEDEWTARLPSAMLGFFAMLMVGYTGYRIWDARTGALAAATLGGSWAYFLAAQYLTLDMTLTASLTFALCSFLRAQTENAALGRKTWMLAAWGAAALAVLSKGLIGVVLPAVTLFIYIVLRRETVLLGRLRPIAGGVLFLLIASPWFVAVQHRNPEFFDFFFIHEHFQRFAESGHNRPGAWWYYIPILIVGLMPWTPTLLKECAHWYKERLHPASGFSPEWFCVAWASVIVLFFSASHSKLPAYILPALPGIALVCARGIQTRGSDSLKWSAWSTALLGIALFGLVPLLPHLKKFAALGEDAIKQIPWLYVAAGALLATGLAALWFVRRNRILTTALALAVGTLGFWNLIFDFLHMIDADFSSERLIEDLTGDRKPYRPEAPFYTVGQFDHSVPFYLGRTVTLVNIRGELGPGIDAEPYKVIPTLERFEEIWRAQKGDAYAILRPDAIAYFRQRRLPMAELVSDKRLVVVSRRGESQ